MLILKNSIVSFSVAALFSFSGCFAASAAKPVQVDIHNNEQVTIKLSSTDINRVYVRGEKITSIHAPSGLLSAHNDQYGSIYANIYSQKMFTAYFTTNVGRQFSVLMVPMSEPGQTIAFTPKDHLLKKHLHTRHHSRAGKRFEESSDYEQTLVKLIRDGMSGKHPSGYTSISYQAIRSMPEYDIAQYVGNNKHLYEKVRSVELGGDLALRTLTVKNMTNHTITLKANQFYQMRVRAVAIEKERLLPHTITHVIEVLSNV